MSVAGPLPRRDLLPLSCPIPLEGRALRRSFEFARLTDADPADFRDVDLAVLDSDPLGDTESEVSSFPRAEPGKAATLLDEESARYSP